MIRNFFSNLSKPIIPVIRLDGIISPSRNPRNINFVNLSKTLDRAFANKSSKAVALVINSPGGSAVQSHLISRRIEELSKQTKIPVFSFIEDYGASGGYLLACAGKEIYCDPFSLVGSIGVISSSFGFVDLTKRIGVERRVTTAGKNKNFNDPFLAQTEENKKRIQDILDTSHIVFKDYVKERRSGKLKGTDEVLFEGDIWVGEKALQVGLVDGIGTYQQILKNKFGEVKFRVMNRSPSIFPDFGASIVSDMVDELQTKSSYGKKIDMRL